MRFVLFVILSGVVALSGCAYIGPHSDYRAQNQYNTYAPKYSNEQKAAMSTEQKLDEYNKHVRIDDRVACRRQKTVGTHFPRTTCTTREERSEQRVAAQDYVREQRQTAVRLGGSRRSYGSAGPNPAMSFP